MWILNQSVISPSLISIRILVGVARLALIATIEVVEQVASLADSGVELHRLLDGHGLEVAVLLPHVQLSRVILHIEGQRADAHLISIENVDFI
jgi:hypothetical protein